MWNNLSAIVDHMLPKKYSRYKYNARVKKYTSEVIYFHFERASLSKNREFRLLP